MSIISSTEGVRRTAIYIRVSTQEQKIDGYGLEAQKTRLLEYISNNTALNLVTKDEWIFEDTSTGSDLNRQGYKDMMEYVKAKKFDAVLVWKIDRLSRSLKHLLNIFEELRDNGVSFISVQENIDFKGPIGQLIFQVFGAIAQFERELIKGRTSMGKIASAEMGNYTGNYVPYGYDEVKNDSGKGKKLKLITKEKKQVEEMYNWYIYEGLGEGQIAKRLNELGVPKGKCASERHKYSKWTAKNVNNITTNTVYKGIYVANKTDEEGNELSPEKWTNVIIPKCVSDLVFNQAQEVRNNRTGGNKSTDYLLSGKMIDTTLDPPKAFTGAKRSNGGFSYRRKQFDKDGIHYPVFEVPGKQMEDYVWSKILNALRKPELFINTYLASEQVGDTAIDKLTEQLDGLKEREANIGLKISRIEEAYEKGLYDEEKTSNKILEKEKEIEEVRGKIIEIEDKIRFASSVHLEASKLNNASEQVKYRLDKLDRKQKKILCNMFIDKIEMSRAEAPSSGKRKNWKIDAQISFRFNPDKLCYDNMEGRTEKEQGKNKKGGKKNKNGGFGVKRGT